MASKGLGTRPPTPAQDVSGMDPEDRIEAMVDWFSMNFEDPAEETPYDGREGGYLYIWGGPYDISEELADAFGAATDEERDEAISRIDDNSGGIVDWAPAGNRIQPEDDGEPETPDEGPEGGEPEAREQLAATLAQIDAVVAELKAVSPPPIGHNNPPESIDQDVATALETASTEVKAELEKPEPDTTVLWRIRNFFKKIGERIGPVGWLVIGGVGKHAMDDVSASIWGKLKPLLGMVAEQIGAWLSYLPHVF